LQEGGVRGCFSGQSLMARQRKQNRLLGGRGPKERFTSAVVGEGQKSKRMIGLQSGVSRSKKSKEDERATPRKGGRKGERSLWEKTPSKIK